MVLLFVVFSTALMPVGLPSSINTKSLQPTDALYLSIVPIGTYNVALLNVLSVKVLSLDVLPFIENGFSISEIIVGISAAVVFASCFISITCALNGRKVMTWIL